MISLNVFNIDNNKKPVEHQNQHISIISECHLTVKTEVIAIENPAFARNK